MLILVCLYTSWKCNNLLFPVYFHLKLRIFTEMAGVNFYTSLLPGFSYFFLLHDFIRYIIWLISFSLPSTVLQAKSTDVCFSFMVAPLDTPPRCARTLGNTLLGLTKHKHHTHIWIQLYLRYCNFQLTYVCSSRKTLY